MAFIGEFLILLGAWKADPILTAVAATGVIFGAVYMLWMVPKSHARAYSASVENEKLSDLSLREREFYIGAAYFLPSFFMGLYPTFFFEKMEPSIKKFIQQSSSGFVSSNEKPASMFAKLIPSEIRN